MSTQHRQRLMAYALIVIALGVIGWAVPRAWATQEQARLSQTVPTATPVMLWTPSPDHDAPSATPGSRPPAATFTPEPTSSSAPGPAATQSGTGAVLVLTQEVVPFLAWPGVRVDFILTLRNTGATSVRQVVLEDVLPDGLDPVALSSPGADWEGRTLRARIALLPPGGQTVVGFSAIVRADAVQGGLLVSRAQATAPGALTAQADAALVLPPVGLPVVGDAMRR